MTGLTARLSGARGGFALEAEIAAPNGTVTALFGPSGAGKTSLLRAIAGLERLDGVCALDGTVWQDERVFVPAHRRAVGYVFQEASLFPHLTVEGNLRYALRRAAGTPVIALGAAIGLLGLAPLLARSPATLSGGERQRVAIGRALLAQPRLLLLDEPMTGLDGAARAEIVSYLEALRGAVSLPVLLVTHDVGEVERLADRLILLRAGQVVAAGPLGEVLVGDALGRRTEHDAAAVLQGRIASCSDDGLTGIDIGGASLLVAGRVGAIGARVRVRIAARDVSLAVERPSATTILNVLAGTIEAVEPAGEAEAVVRLAVAGQVLLARVTRRSVRLLGLRPGLGVFAQVKGVSVLASQA
jgi:molybdate transport system ATP-binding protein